LRMSGAMAARWFSVMDVYHLTSPKVVGSSPALFVQLFVLHACLELLHFRADGHLIVAKRSSFFWPSINEDLDLERLG
jgi:hypothetical protein